MPKREELVHFYSSIPMVHCCTHERTPEELRLSAVRYQGYLFTTFLDDLIEAIIIYSINRPVYLLIYTYFMPYYLLFSCLIIVFCCEKVQSFSSCITCNINKDTYTSYPTCHPYYYSYNCWSRLNAKSKHNGADTRNDGIVVIISSHHVSCLYYVCLHLQLIASCSSTQPLA